MINSLSNYVSWWCNITEDISAFRGYAELDELEYHLDLLNRHKREMRDAIDEALQDDEVKRRLQSAIDNIKYFCQEVGRIHRQREKIVP